MKTKLGLSVVTPVALAWVTNMIGCKTCMGTGFNPNFFAPCDDCGGLGNFLSEGEVRFGDVANWQWVVFCDIPLLKVDGSHVISLGGELGEFYSSDIVKPIPELSNIVKVAVENYLAIKGEVSNV